MVILHHVQLTFWAFSLPHKAPYHLVASYDMQDQQSFQIIFGWQSQLLSETTQFVDIIQHNTAQIIFGILY